MDTLKFIEIAGALVVLLVTVVGLYLNYGLSNISQLQVKEAHRTNQLIQFETTFFNLLSTQRAIVSEMDIRTNDTGVIIKSGRDCFKHFYKKLYQFDFERRIKGRSPKAEFFTLEELQEIPLLPFSKIIGLYENKVFSRFEGDLSHYFRNLYHTIRFVDESNLLSDDRKKHYIRLIRAQLSSFELIIIYYNCISKYGKDKFKPLINKYNLLKNIATKNLIYCTDKQDYYDFENKT